MKRIVNAFRHPAKHANADTEESNKDDEQQEEVDSDHWDSRALERMNPYQHQRQAYAMPVASRAAPVLLTCAFGGGGPAPQMRMAKCKVAAAAPPPMMMAAPAPCAAVAPGGAAFGAAEGAAIGFKTGGAQDAANFRENIAAGKLPLPSDVTYEGLIKDYFFDTSPAPVAAAGDGGWVDVGCNEPPPPRPTELFAPTYSLALAPEPLLAAARGDRQAAGANASAQQQDVFLAVGLDSGITDFRRPRLNLCILLDVSGSMDCCFNRYYYDAAAGKQAELSDKEARRSKLDVAKEVMKGMLDRLAPDDCVCISLFSDAAASPKRMGRWGSADAAGIKAGIDALRTVGGTNFQAGLDEATAQLRGWGDCTDGDPLTTENRIIILTDAEANCGDISETGLLARLKANAADRLYTTIVGVGLDFQSSLVESIMKVRGAAYFSVHTPGDFKRRLEAEFDFSMAPLVFDLELRVDPASLAPAQQGATPPRGRVDPAGMEVDPQRPLSDAATEAEAGAEEAAAGPAAGAEPGAPAGGWRVVHVYGSPDSEERRLSGGGSIMRVSTLFPSAKTEEGIKGGVVLLRMRPPPDTTALTAPPLRLSARYADRSGKQYDTLRVVEVPRGSVRAAAGDGACSAPRAAVAADLAPAYFQSSGVRKAVVLARLVDALQCWLADEWTTIKFPQPPSADAWNNHVAAALGAASAPPAPSPAHAPSASAGEASPQLRLRPGCPLLPPEGLQLDGQGAAGAATARAAGASSAVAPAPWQQLGRWERASQALRVGPQAKAAFRQLLPYVEAEVAALGDGDMRQEVELLQKLLAA